MRQNEERLRQNQKKVGRNKVGLRQKKSTLKSEDTAEIDLLFPQQCI